MRNFELEVLTSLIVMAAIAAFALYGYSALLNVISLVVIFLCGITLSLTLWSMYNGNSVSATIQKLRFICSKTNTTTNVEHECLKDLGPEARAMVDRLMTMSDDTEPVVVEGIKIASNELYDDVKSLIQEDGDNLIDLVKLGKVDPDSDTPIPIQLYELGIETDDCGVQTPSIQEQDYISQVEDAYDDYLQSRMDDDYFDMIDRLESVEDNIPEL